MTAGTATDVVPVPLTAACMGGFVIPEGGVARGAVVLCPPVGNEQIVSQLTLRMFAEHLAAHGIAALRFDYPAPATLPEHFPILTWRSSGSRRLALPFSSFVTVVCTTLPLLGYEWARHWHPCGGSRLPG